MTAGHALHGGRIALLFLSICLSAHPNAQAPQLTANTAIVFDHWIDAVLHHMPGQMDNGIAAIDRMSSDDRGELRNGMAVFRDALLKKPVRVSSAAEKRVADFGNDLARDLGASQFLERAVLLHSDAAIVSLLRPNAVATARPTPGETLGGVPRPNQQLLERDGEVVGVSESNWNWAFARNLIGLQDATASLFASDWFHVTTTFLMARRMFGDAQAQMNLAATLLPKDARNLFDRGCYAEMQGSPASQVLLSSEDVAQMRGVTRGSLVRRSSDAARIGVRPAEQENAEAERLFRSTLDADPDFAEARVRLARLLELRGRHTEAADELNRAQATLSKLSRPDPALMFFLHLFAGRVDRTQNHLDAAAGHFREALTLFPDAQSALLGASHVALLGADADGAMASVRGLKAGSASVEFRSDPWWNYNVGLGRNAEALLTEFWVRARAR